VLYQFLVLVLLVLIEIVLLVLILILIIVLCYIISIYFFCPMPPHVLMNFRGFLPGCVDSVADF